MTFSAPSFPLLAADAPLATRRNWLARQIALLHFLSCGAFTLYFSLTKFQPKFSLIMAGLIGVLGMPIWVPPTSPYFSWAKIMHLVASYVAVTAVGFFLGPGSNVHLISIVIFLTALLIIGGDQRGLLGVLLFVTILTFFLPMVATNVHWFPAEYLTPDQIVYFRFAIDLTVFATVMIEVALLAALLHGENQKTERQNRDLFATLKEKNYLMRVLSHDVKSPLINSLSALNRLNEESFEPAVSRRLREIHASNQSTKEILDNVAWYASDMKFTGTLDKTTMKLGDLVRRLLLIFSSRLEEKQIQLQWSESELDSTNVYANFDTLCYQVLGNLLSNAIKFSPVGGSLSWSIQWNESGAELTLRDYGVGLPPRFSCNAGRSRLGTQGERGAGLGLMIAQRFTEANGLRLLLATPPEGAGTLATVHFPEGIAFRSYPEDMDEA